MSERMSLNDRIERDFTYHPPNTDTVPKYDRIRTYASKYAQMLSLTCPESRELSLAITKLEEVVMWANAAVARNKP